MPPSLAAAAEAALKVKADARGSFAQLAITAAEEAYKAKLAAQKGELSEADFGKRWGGGAQLRELVDPGEPLAEA